MCYELLRALAQQQQPLALSPRRAVHRARRLPRFFHAVSSSATAAAAMAVVAMAAARAAVVMAVGLAEEVRAVAKVVEATAAVFLIFLKAVSLIHAYHTTAKDRRASTAHPACSSQNGGAIHARPQRRIPPSRMHEHLLEEAGWRLVLPSAHDQISTNERMQSSARPP